MAAILSKINGQSPRYAANGSRDVPYCTALFLYGCHTRANSPEEDDQDARAWLDEGGPH
jgi:hypothetical protein